MTTIIKNVFFALAPIWFTSCSSHSYVLFEHIGESDKPIRCVIITEKSGPRKQFCEFQEEYISEAQNFKLLENYVRSNNTKINATGTTNSFGTFKVYIDNYSYIIEGNQKSVLYFKNLIAKLNSSGDHKLAELLEQDILIRLIGV